jgi:hypothetical protein
LSRPKAAMNRRTPKSARSACVMRTSRKRERRNLHRRSRLRLVEPNRRREMSARRTAPCLLQAVGVSTETLFP